MYVELTIPRGTESLGKLIDDCVQACIKRWDRCTVTDGIGYWCNPDSGVIEAEPVAILGVDCGAESCKDVVDCWFHELATVVRERGHQHTSYYRVSESAGRMVSR
jgi:hypothetical protein